MAEQRGTTGFTKVILPVLVLGILIGSAITSAFFLFNEGGTLPKPSGTTPTERSTTPREVGGAVDTDDASASQDEDPPAEQTGDEQTGDQGDGADGATDDSPPEGEGG